MSKKKHPLHFLMLAAGIFLMGTGIAIIIKSQTGTSPMSSLTNVMTYVYAPISLGTYTFFLLQYIYGLRHGSQPCLFPHGCLSC